MDAGIITDPGLNTDLTSNVLGANIHISTIPYKSKQVLTLIQGIPDIFDFKRILRHWKKQFNCNGAVKENKSTREMHIQLSGDHRREVAEFLYEQGIAEREEIKIHGA